MRNLTFILLLTLSGCLSTTTHHPYKDNRSKVKAWWTTPYYADTPKDQNPWLKFVHDTPDNWNDPWGNDDLQRYGVDVDGTELEKPKAPPEKLKGDDDKFM